MVEDQGRCQLGLEAVVVAEVGIEAGAFLRVDDASRRYVAPILPHPLAALAQLLEADVSEHADDAQPLIDDLLVAGVGEQGQSDDEAFLPAPLERLTGLAAALALVRPALRKARLRGRFHHNSTLPGARFRDLCTSGDLRYALVGILI